MQNPHCSPWSSRNAVCTGDKLPSGAADPLDRRDLGAVGLHGEHQARADGLAVEEHGARAAHTVLAAEVGAGELAVLPEEVGQGQARFDPPPRFAR